jgi:hypothetical protein
MDSIKFAFDPMIVGVLALPWLALLVRMFLKPDKNEAADHHLPLVGALPEHTREWVASLLVFAIGYFLGSAVTRVANNFFDDEFWRVLPNEGIIRVDVYTREYCVVHQQLTGEHQGSPDFSSAGGPDWRTAGISGTCPCWR